MVKKIKVDWSLCCCPFPAVFSQSISKDFKMHWTHNLRLKVELNSRGWIIRDKLHSILILLKPSVKTELYSAKVIACYYACKYLKFIVLKLSPQGICEEFGLCHCLGKMKLCNTTNTYTYEWLRVEKVITDIQIAGKWTSAATAMVLHRVSL